MLINGGIIVMKQWENADLIELKIKSTAQNGDQTGIDLELPGGAAGFYGSDIPSSGSTKQGTMWE